MWWWIIGISLLAIFIWANKSTNDGKNDFLAQMKPGDSWSLKDVGPKEKLIITIKSIGADKIVYKRDYWFLGKLEASSLASRPVDSFYYYIILNGGEKYEAL